MVENIVYAFGPFRLETETQLLRREGAPIRLQPKAYRLLLYFLQHPGRLLSKEELFDAVWHGIIVEDTALRQAVNALRKTLHDESKTPQFILTANKCGYRFLSEVMVETVADDSAAAQERNRHRWYVNPSPTVEKHNAELAQLLDAYEQASAGKRHLVFLSGERSAGKTALLESFLATIGNNQSALLRARCVRFGGAEEPFLPLLEALERRCREPCGKSLIDCLHRIAPTWLYQMLNVLDTEQMAVLSPKVSNITTGRMLREGADFFETLGNESPFVLMLDNSQWSDEFTLDLLNFLALRCSATRLLMIVSYRPDGNAAAVRRLTEMQEELLRHGVCREVCL